MSTARPRRTAFRILPRTLRARLLTGILVLVSAGLLATDLGLYHAVRSALTTRADRALLNTATAINQAQSRPTLDLRNVDTLLKRTVIAVVLLDPDRRIIAALPHGASPQQPEPVPRLDPTTLARLSCHPGRPMRLDVAGTPYRVLYQPARGGSHVHDAAGVRRPLAAVVIATSFRNERETLHRLAATEATVSAAVVAVLSILAVGVLRVGLRPLAGLAAAATAIATGESDRRLPVEQPHSEVGRLATALNRAFDERQQAEERLRHFIADASHELRTPLATIRGWADLYFQGALTQPDDVETAMTRIVDDADRLTRLVEELFLLAHLNQHRLLDTAPVDLTTLVNEVIEDARVADPTRQITLSTPHADAVTVIADPDRLRQVARNLIGNALQHTPPGTPVRVTLHTSPTEPPTVRLTVADDGPGIPEADLEHLFERFYRPAGAPATTGTGLGLAIVHAIVQAHGGTITVDSGPDTGTRFQVTLPHPKAG